MYCFVLGKYGFGAKINKPESLLNANTKKEITAATFPFCNIFIIFAK